MSVTVEEILRAAGAGAAALTGETAGYLVLGAAESAGAASGPLSRSGIVLREDGAVVVAAVEPRSGTTGAEDSLRSLLGVLLSCCPPPSPALVRLASGRSGAVAGITRELEAALIPLNRAAARRALARLCRDTTRALAAGLPAAVAADVPLSADAAEPPSRATTPVVSECAPLAAAAPTPVVPEVVQSPGPELAPPPALAAAAPEEPAVLEPVPPATTPAAAAESPAPLSVVVPAPGPVEAMPEGDATPFLGSLWGLGPVRTALRGEREWSPPPEPDTEPQPPVTVEETVVVGTVALREVAERDAAPAAPASGPVSAAPEEPAADSVAPTPAPATTEPEGPAEAFVAAVLEEAAPEAAPLEAAPPELAADAASSARDEAAADAASSAPEEAADEALSAPVAAAMKDAAAEDVDSLPELLADEDVEWDDEEIAPEAEPERPRVVFDAAAARIAAALWDDDVGGAGEDFLAPALAQVVAQLPAPPPPPPEPYLPRQSDVSELLSGFMVAETKSLKEISRELKQIAGVAATPAPPDVAQRPLSSGARLAR